MFNHSININQKNNHLSTQTIEHKTNKITTYGVVIGQIYVYSKSNFRILYYNTKLMFTENNK
jgi:hypothetical protein